MLATLGTLPPEHEDERYAYEMKWDGVRILAHVQRDGVRLVARSGADVTVTYPELADLGSSLPGRTAWLDGEVVVLGADGTTDFGALQSRMHVSSAAKARTLAAVRPVTYLIFDVLEVDGDDTTRLPYAKRRELLESLGMQGPHWQTPPAFFGGGADVREASVRLGLEGVVAKRVDSPYRVGRRSSEWIKVKNFHTQEVVIGGWTPGEGRRSVFFGSLLLGLPTRGGLRYVGNVGSGFTEEMLYDLRARLRDLAQPTSPFVGPVDPRRARAARWVRPELVAEVSYAQLTADGRLRHPVWRGLRPDKRPAEVQPEF